MAAPGFSDPINDSDTSNHSYDDLTMKAELEEEMSYLDDHLMESRTASILDPKNFFFGRGTMPMDNNRPKAKFNVRIGGRSKKWERDETAGVYSIDTKERGGPRDVIKPHDARWREITKYHSPLTKVPPAYVTNFRRNTCRKRVAVQSLTLVGNETRRKTVDAGVYAHEHGPHQNSNERGLHRAKMVQFSDNEHPLKIRIKITRDEMGNEHYATLPPRD